MPRKDSPETVGKIYKKWYFTLKIGLQSSLHYQQNELDVVQLMHLMFTTAK
jgi:hypothetical protein